jgi:hypothetical protein
VFSDFRDIVNEVFFDIEPQDVGVRFVTDPDGAFVEFGRNQDRVFEGAGASFRGNGVLVEASLALSFEFNLVLFATGCLILGRERRRGLWGDGRGWGWGKTAMKGKKRG